MLFTFLRTARCQVLFRFSFLGRVTNILLGNLIDVLTHSGAMHHLYNLDDYTTNSTLSLKANLKWVTLTYDMHELVMSE